MAENTIDNLSIQVTASAENAARVFDRLASSAGRLRGAAQGAAGGMQDMAQGAKDAGTATATAGEQAGQAQPRIRGVGNAAKDAGDNAKKGASGLATFWQSLKRIAFYRFIRSVIKEITAAFSEGIKNLYHWSDLVNGHFAASMDRLATSSQYLKNSLGAMVSPLIETLVPVLDVIIDKIVDVLNFFNMLVSAVSGADTYTVAKKAAAVWDDSANKTRKAAKSAADDIKRTILGFDEINKLVKPNSSSGGSGSSYGKSTPNYSAMFEEKPLTGIFKKISDITSGWPDWLKALLGVGTAGLAIFGIPALLKSIWDWLKKLFTMNIPDWFRWLFGPKGSGDGEINLPKEIKLPDAEVGVDLKKDDWSVLDKIPKDVTVPVKLGKSGWTSLSAFVGIFSPLVYIRLGRSGWKSLSDFIGTYSPLVYVRLGKAGWKTLSNFVGTYNPIVNVRLKKDGWTTLSAFVGTYSPTVYVKLAKAAWTTLAAFVGIYSPTVYVQLGKAGWSTLEAFVGQYSVNVPVQLVRTWFGSAISHLGLDNLRATVYVDAFAPWLYFGTSAIRWLQMDNLNATVHVEMWTPWWYFHKSPLEWLQMDNLSTTVTVYTRTVNTGVTGGGRNTGVTDGGSKTAGGGGGRGRHAKGGIFSGGAWSDIPQYAGGTTNAHGSLFLAGEAGPEIVGHVGGRTEVLNKSQLASAMYSAVQAAMAPAAANFAEAAANMGVAETGFDFETLADMVRQGVEQAMIRSNDYDRQKVELLRSINDKDFNVDVSTASINKAQSRMNRRAGVTIAPVGT